MIRYREVDAADVPRRTRQAAELAVRFAAGDLVTAVPDIRWFLPAPTTAREAFASMLNEMSPPEPPDAFEHKRRILGKAGADDAVWLLADRDARRTAAVALHETCHVWQRRQIGPAHGPHEHEGRERQARSYSADLAEVARAIANTVKGAQHNA